MSVVVALVTLLAVIGLPGVGLQEAAAHWPCDGGTHNTIHYAHTDTHHDHGVKYISDGIWTYKYRVWHTHPHGTYVDTYCGRF